MKENKKLKMYVWEGSGVLQDYSSGMICVLATNFEEAVKLVTEKCGHCTTSFPINQYKVITKPEAFVCWGGG